jgi:hypothetical protein
LSSALVRRETDRVLGWKKTSFFEGEKEEGFHSNENVVGKGQALYITNTLSLSCTLSAP